MDGLRLWLLALTKRLIPAEQDLNFRPSGYEAGELPPLPYT